MFHSYFERKNDKVLTFNIVHFPNFEVSAPSNQCHPLISAAPNSFKFRGNAVYQIFMCQIVLNIF